MIDYDYKEICKHIKSEEQPVNPKGKSSLESIYNRNEAAIQTPQKQKTPGMNADKDAEQPKPDATGKYKTVTATTAGRTRNEPAPADKSKACCNFCLVL